jgi:hypothetical protein
MKAYKEVRLMDWRNKIYRVKYQVLEINLLILVLTLRVPYNIKQIDLEELFEPLKPKKKKAVKKKAPKKK